MCPAINLQTERDAIAFAHNKMRRVTSKERRARLAFVLAGMQETFDALTMCAGAVENNAHIVHLNPISGEVNFSGRGDPRRTAHAGRHTMRVPHYRRCILSWQVVVDDAKLPYKVMEDVEWLMSTLVKQAHALEALLA